MLNLPSLEPFWSGHSIRRTPCTRSPLHSARYVERLVIPTLVEPLREDWRNALAVITEQVNAGDAAAAIETAHAFHRQLCSTRVLDPACGSGNFLYVALEHMNGLKGKSWRLFISW